ncbi:MAG: DUF6285 domain-containing protein, partial [Acidimicrobiales bacterium]
LHDRGQGTLHEIGMSALGRKLDLYQYLALAAAHAERLAALGLSSEAELAAAIRSGRLDDRWDDVAAAVRATVADKLAVASPDYA